MNRARSGRAIRDARLEKGYSQAVLGQAVGISHAAISYAEDGTNILTDLYIRRIAQALNLDPLPLLELAAIDRGKLSISDKPLRVQKLMCRIAHGELSDKAMERLASIVEEEQELIAA